MPPQNSEHGFHPWTQRAEPMGHPGPRGELKFRFCLVAIFISSRGYVIAPGCFQRLVLIIQSAKRSRNCSKWFRDIEHGRIVSHSGFSRDPWRPLTKSSEGRHEEVDFLLHQHSDVIQDWERYWLREWGGAVTRWAEWRHFHKRNDDFYSSIDFDIKAALLYEFTPNYSFHRIDKNNLKRKHCKNN